MIGIVVAMPTEAAPFLRNGVESETEICGKRFYKLAGADAVLVACGIGKVNAAYSTTLLIDRFSPDVILNCGVSGGLSSAERADLPEVKILDVIVATGCVQHDVDTSPIGDPKGLVSTVNMIVFPTDKEASEIIKSSCECKEGICASGEQFVASHERKEEIISLFNAIACDMESGAVAQCAYVAGKKYVCVRCVSDCGDGRAPEDYGRFCKEAAEKIYEAVRPLIYKR